MNKLRTLLLIAASFFLAGCSKKGECDNILQTHYESWNRIVEGTEADTIFQSARYPLTTPGSGA